MDIVVFGAGAVGSLIGGLLAREHAVTLVGRDPHMKAVAADGLHVTGAITDRTYPEATTDGQDRQAQLAIVTVKAYDTDTAAQTLATGKYDAVLSLQNGLGNEETLAAALPADTTVLAGTTTYGASVTGPGVVQASGLGTVTLGHPTGAQSPIAETAGHAFRTAGITTTVTPEMPRVLWKKLAINVGVNPVTAVLDCQNGALESGPERQTATRATRETARVARAHGIELSEETAITALRETITTTADNVSSMCQDLRAGERTEIDAIAGTVIDNAETAAVPVPTVRTLAELVRARTALGGSHSE